MGECAGRARRGECPVGSAQWGECAQWRVPSGRGVCPGGCGMGIVSWGCGPGGCVGLCSGTVPRGLSRARCAVEATPWGCAMR